MQPGYSIVPSLLDRLIDDAPERQSETLDRPFDSLTGVTASVGRDLSALLNARRAGDNGHLPDLNASVFRYGLPDITSCNPHSPSGRAWLERLLESVLTVHEPRLRGIAVVCEAAANPMRAVRFRIEASLVVESRRLPVTFDATLNLDDGRFSVDEA